MKNVGEQKSDMHSGTRRIAISWLLVAAWACLIFAMSAKTGQSLDSGMDLVVLVKRWLQSLVGPGKDVSPLGHFAEYFVFGLLLANAVRHHRAGWAVVLIAAGIASIYGATDEFHQLFVPQRSCEVAPPLLVLLGLVGNVGDAQRGVSEH